MASTNVNTDNKNILSTDIYEISEFLDQIRADTITDLNETSSIVGIFGYMNEMFSQTMQNSLVVISETVNETIPTRAKFTKNVISHAMNLGITDICATPAVMTMMIYLPTTYIVSNFVEGDNLSDKAKFILSRECPISVGGHEFHLDYDIIFTRIKNSQGKYVYTAIYDLYNTGTSQIKQTNPISDITNPYISTVTECTINGTDFIAFSARLHQVTLTTVEKNILTSNPIENKAVTFTFDGQLAAFDLDVIENDKVIHLTPIYSGLLDYTIPDSSWCHYNYINENTIRILFSKDSYVPSMNAIVRINIQISEGSNGNFTYNNNFKTSLKSETYNDYNGMYAYIYPLLGGSSINGKDKKSVSDIKKIIPRESSSRGAIINTTDLNNFFNSINNDECKLYFKKKKDNQFERMYYTYMLMRKNGYVYPTNTLNAKLNQKDFTGFDGNNNLTITPGTKFYYYDHGTDYENDYATIEPPEYASNLDPDIYPYYDSMTTNVDGNLVRVFEYTTPFLISIDDDLISSYLLTMMNDNKTFTFESDNKASNLRFITTNMNWKRSYIPSNNNKDNSVDNKYTMDLLMTQNDTSSDYHLVNYYYDENNTMKFHKDANGKDDIRVRIFMVLYSDETQTHPYRYLEAKLTEYDPKNHIYSFRFTLETDDKMDLNNRINIKGIYNCKPEEFQHKINLNNSNGYMKKNTFAKIFIMADFGYKKGDELPNDEGTVNEDIISLYPPIDDINPGNRDEIEKIIPTRSDIEESFLNNEIYLEKGDGTQANVISIIRSNPDYIKEVNEYNGNKLETETEILKYLRNNLNSDFVQNILLKDEYVIEVIDSYNYEDLDRYTLCNVLSVNEGIDFYHDYSSMMRSTVIVEPIQETDEDGDLVYKEIPRTDSLGNTYIEAKPIYRMNSVTGNYEYDYDIKRIPLIKDNYLNTEELMQEFIYDIEERRKYIEECLYILEDTFDIDLKFFNTYGPSKTFYYNIPSSQNYKVRVAIQELNVFDNNTENEDDETKIIHSYELGSIINILKTRGQWGYVKIPKENENDDDKYGWVKLADTTKVINYIDNVALTMKFALEASTSADKYIGNSIIYDIKEYIEDINEINELHIPNIITFITNNYREQLVYFEFLDVNNYGAACQHLYLDDQINADICPEFLNIDTLVEGINEPNISITVY